MRTLLFVHLVSEKVKKSILLRYTLRVQLASGFNGLFYLKFNVLINFTVLYFKTFTPHFHFIIFLFKFTFELVKFEGFGGP